MTDWGGQNEAARRGFTVIELLVVIAIISVLAAMLMPSLRRAAEAARSASCTGSLHQIGLAFTHYHRTYEGTLPSHDDEPGLVFNNWGERMWWRTAHGHCVPFLGDHAVFRCPSDRNPRLTSILGANKWFSYTWSTASGHFRYRQESTGKYSALDFRYRKITQCKRPSDIIIFMDCNEGDGGTDGNDDRAYQPGGAAEYYDYTRHNGGWNALFMDGKTLHYYLGETAHANYNW